jgi:vacuolar-type H+-ATPase subunit I/STV1
LQDVITSYQQRHASAYLPAFDAFNQHRTQLVILLDEALAQKKFTASEKNKLVQLISNISGELLGHDDNPEIRAIFDRHNEVSFDQQVEEDQEMLKEMMEAMLGMPVDAELDLRDPETIMRMMAEKAQEAQEAMNQEAAQAKPRKKTAKQIAKEEKLLEDEKKVSQSIREVYRKLASALHPDREPDEAERQRKTDLMQRVNVAYDKLDLLALLELQLEIEQIDQHAIAAISEEKLKHYNQILAEQAEELGMEIAAAEFHFTMQYPELDEEPWFVGTVIAELDEKIGDIQYATESLEQDLISFKEVKNLKAFLKTIRLQRKPVADFGDFFEGIATVVNKLNDS